MDLLRSLPIGLYIEKPFSWLHRLDPRVKLGWLMSLILSPLLANSSWRIFLVIFLLLITWLSFIPWRVQKKQITWLLLVGILIFILTAFAPDGLSINYQPRLPESDININQPTDYQYILYSFGNFNVTRRSFDLAIRVSTLFFTLIYSSNLFLLTTAPEEITAGIEDLLSPLNRFKFPVTEMILTLTLSLRFIPLVLEEIQNLIRSIRTRAIKWRKLGIKKSVQIWVIVMEKLLENILLRAEQIAIAMESRGFTNPKNHEVQWHESRIKTNDVVALFFLVIFWLFRVAIGQM
ncbi:CbiQ family ECF transporter T component [Cyanobacterium stanieri LEGE 03274]|uniref:CbiQ family ECF transporter T component n=1 Tax=Cyanobacterium stanieri LEGE 03274 TaxID=1828756 RepID=A0ABR9V5Z3_9CHRO|nr:CbiQ family ECF transporter T component [Cyanobacterium stanieri]MBE9222546.1 CbiQ family ECF transporter T component [Cyanobacterium stanieri LEGE 03274]